MWTTLTIAAAQVPCEARSDAPSIQSTLDEALASYERLDEDGFRVQLLEATADLLCLDEPVDRGVVASFHRLNGLDAFSARDLPLAERHFAAARAADPSYAFPTDLIPTGNPIRRHYAALKLGDLELAELPAPAVGSVFVDGRLGLGWRRSLPAVFQRTDANGTVVQNLLLSPDAATPDYPSLQPRPERRGSGVPLLVAAATSIVASGAVYGAAWASGAKVRKQQGVDDLDHGRRIQTRTNALVVTSGGLLAVGAGLGVAAVVQGGF